MRRRYLQVLRPRGGVQKVLDSLSVSTGELVILSCEDEVTALFGGTDSKEATTDRDKKEEFLEKKVVLT